MTAFQRAAGPVADGIARPKTQAALTKVNVSERCKAPDKRGRLALAEALSGHREALGTRNNLEVEKLFADAELPSIKTDSTAWCAAFMNAVLERG